MATRTIRDGDDYQRFNAWLRDFPYPYTATVLKGAETRTKAQNRTIHKWFGEIAKQKGDDTPATVKAECNRQYGIPILRRDNPEWASVFGYLFDSLTYSAQLKAIRILDVPITRDMSVAQLREYMDEMVQDYSKQGIRLTIPEEAR